MTGMSSITYGTGEAKPQVRVVMHLNTQGKTKRATEFRLPCQQDQEKPKDSSATMAHDAKALAELIKQQSDLRNSLGRKPRVLVGMSGGVDSSVAAALLVEAGYDVCGAYMKNWILDVPGMRCPWADDLADAKRTAVRLGIGFRVYDFQDAYKREVVDYLVSEYRAGRTPNPDVMCNQEVKFGLFLDAALEDGFDFIATGHYSQGLAWLPVHPAHQIL